MSYAIDAANRLHHRQVEAATRAQDLLIKAFGGLIALRDKAPQPPERVTAPLAKMAGPLTKVVGSPGQVADYVGQAQRDWLELQRRFAGAVNDLRQTRYDAERSTVEDPESANS